MVSATVAVARLVRVTRFLRNRALLAELLGKEGKAKEVKNRDELHERTPTCQHLAICCSARRHVPQPKRSTRC